MKKKLRVVDVEQPDVEFVFEVDGDRIVKIKKKKMKCKYCGSENVIEHPDHAAYCKDCRKVQI